MQVEAYLTAGRLYERLFAADAADEERDLTLQGRIRALRWVTPAHLEARVRLPDPVRRRLVDSLCTPSRPKYIPYINPTPRLCAPRRCSGIWRRRRSSLCLLTRSVRLRCGAPFP